VRSVLAADWAILAELEPLSLALVLAGMVVPALALLTREGYVYSHSYSITSTTVPAPTVRPPSRIANFEFCSRATGAISSMSIVMWSPGITISTPSGRAIEPVTSVVRM